MQLEKKIFGLISLLCFFALGFALISQHVYGMAPCAWCVLQRLIYLFISALSAYAYLRPIKRLRASLASAVLLALCFLGISAAWYQINFAAKSFSCVQGLADQVMVSSGLDESLPWLFGIFSSCADASVKILGVEYAHWSLLLYATLGVLATINTARILKIRAN